MSLKTTCLVTIFALCAVNSACLAETVIDATVAEYPLTPGAPIPNRQLDPYDANETFSVDLMLVEVNADAVSPVARLTAKEVLMLAAEPEKSKVIARHRSTIMSNNQQRATSVETIYVESQQKAQRDSEPAMISHHYSPYDIKKEFSLMAFKHTLRENRRVYIGHDKVGLQIRAKIEWFQPQVDANNPQQDRRNFDTEISTILKFDRPAIVSAVNGTGGMQYLIATVEAVKP